MARVKSQSRRVNRIHVTTSVAVTTARYVLRMRMEETASRYVLELRIYRIEVADN
jgi:hypothetical protein